MPRQQHGECMRLLFDARMRVDMRVGERVCARVHACVRAAGVAPLIIIIVCDLFGGCGPVERPRRPDVPASSLRARAGRHWATGSASGIRLDTDRNLKVVRHARPHIHTNLTCVFRTCVCAHEELPPRQPTRPSRKHAHVHTCIASEHELKAHIKAATIEMERAREADTLQTSQTASRRLACNSCLAFPKWCWLFWMCGRSGTVGMHGLART